MKRITINLQDNMDEFLRKEAKKQNRTLSNMISNLVNRYHGEKRK